MARNLTRKQFLASAGLLGGIATLPVGEISPSPVVEVGSLWQVVSSSGSRAGMYGPRTGRLAVDRQSFTSEDAYADLGFWYFFYGSEGQFAAVRSLQTKLGGNQRTFVVPGADGPEGPVFLSSIGTIAFARGDKSDRRTCRILAPNYAEARLEDDGERGSSPYFLCRQELLRRSASTLDAGHRELMNGAIAEYAARAGLPPAQVVPIPG